MSAVVGAPPAGRRWTTLDLTAGQLRAAEGGAAERGDVTTLDPARRLLAGAGLAPHCITRKLGSAPLLCGLMMLASRRRCMMKAEYGHVSAEDRIITCGERGNSFVK